MNYLKVKSVYRNTLLASCVCGVIGLVLITRGLQTHLFSYTMMSLSVLTPVMTTIVYHSKLARRWAIRPEPFEEQAEIFYEAGFLIVSVMVMALIAKLQREEYKMSEQAINVYDFDSWYESVLGAAFLGGGIGLYKRIARA